MLVPSLARGPAALAARLAGLADVGAAGVPLQAWSTVARVGAIPTVPPFFLRSDFSYAKPVFDPAAHGYSIKPRTDGACDLWSVQQSVDGPQLSYEGGFPCDELTARFTTPGYWWLNLYGAPHASYPYYASDPNYLYQLGPELPDVFYFGIKSGKDQGYIYKYQRDPATDTWLPVATSGLVGERGGLFDSNAFTRYSNKMAAIIAVALIGGAFVAYAAAPAAAAGEGAVVGGSTTAVVTPAEAAAMYGGEAIVGGGTTTAVVTPAEAAAMYGGTSIPPASSSSAWGALIDKAVNTAGSYAANAVIKQISGGTKPGQAPAHANGLAPGAVVLPDGSIATVGADGTVTVAPAGGGPAQVIGPGGAVSQQWVAGIPNLALAAGAGLLLLSALLRG